MKYPKKNQLEIRTGARNRAWPTFLAIGVLVTGLFAACGGPTADPITVPANAQAGDLTLEPCEYEAGDVEYAADCGTLVVPENRGDPNTRLIVLPLTRIRATGNAPREPIFRLTGGPGQSNMAFSLVSWFVENHDIVLVGYRGVDGSVQLHCPEVIEAIKKPGDALGDTALDNLSTAYTDCARRLQDEGIDTDGYTVAEVVDDLEVARSRLGYEQINLLSGSYGTRVAMVYAWIYPELIHRSAMIAVDAPGATVHEAEVVDEQLEYYAGLCAQDAHCSARTEDLAATMQEVARNMPRRWLFLPVNAGLVKVSTHQFLDSTIDAPKMIDIWLAAAKGDPSGMALLTLLGPRMFASASLWGDNAAKRASLGEFDPARDYRAELNPPDSILGSPATTLAYAEYTAWPANLIADKYRQVQPSHVETLLVSGSIDFNTPVQFATDVLLPSLSNGQHVILAEFGHGEMLSLQPEASRRLLTSFFETGMADDSLFTHHPVDFGVGLGYPTQAKLGLAAIVLIVAGLVALVWFIVRRVRLRGTR